MSNSVWHETDDCVLERRTREPRAWNPQGKR